MFVSLKCRSYLKIIVMTSTIFLPTSLAQDLNNASQAEFSIYCNSNMDGTGKCNRVDNSETINCIMIPGQIIACRDKNNRRYHCVQYGAIVAWQTQFSCLSSKENRSDDQFSESRNGAAEPSTPSDLPPSKPTTPNKQQPATIVNPFWDSNGSQTSPKNDAFQDAF